MGESGQGLGFAIQQLLHAMHSARTARLLGDESRPEISDTPLPYPGVTRLKGQTPENGYGLDWLTRQRANRD